MKRFYLKRNNLLKLISFCILLILIVNYFHLKFYSKIEFQIDVDNQPSYLTVSSDLKHFEPSIEISKKRKARFAIGISTVKRNGTSYLKEMLDSLLSAMNGVEREKVQIVLLVAEPSNKIFAEETIQMLTDSFSKEINEGMLDVIVPKRDYYHGLTTLDNFKDHIYNDSSQRIMWRAKQCLDLAYLMNYAQTRATYYLQLEDDVYSSFGFLAKIEKYLSEMEFMDRKEWKLIEFSEIGFIGKLFLTQDLPLFINSFYTFAFFKPVDILLYDVLRLIACDTDKKKIYCDLNLSKMKLRPPTSLFQHFGFKSSLSGKLQIIRDRYFVDDLESYLDFDPPIFKANPDASIICSMKAFDNHTIEGLYNGVNFFLTNEFNEHDFVLIKFFKAFHLKRYIIRSGNLMDSMEFLPFNSTLEIKLTNKKDFILIDQIKTWSTEMAAVVENMNYTNVEQIRINLGKPLTTRWLLLKELKFF